MSWCVMNGGVDSLNVHKMLLLIVNCNTKHFTCECWWSFYSDVNSKSVKVIERRKALHGCSIKSNKSKAIYFQLQMSVFQKFIDSKFGKDILWHHWHCMLLLAVWWIFHVTSSSSRFTYSFALLFPKNHTPRNKTLIAFGMLNKIYFLLESFRNDFRPFLSQFIIRIINFMFIASRRLKLLQIVLVCVNFDLIACKPYIYSLFNNKTSFYYFYC